MFISLICYLYKILFFLIYQMFLFFTKILLLLLTTIQITNSHLQHECNAHEMLFEL